MSAKALATTYRARATATAQPAIVHVLPQARQRQYVVSVMTFASVSTALPWQNGHRLGRATVRVTRDSDIRWVLQVEPVRKGDTSGLIPGCQTEHDRLIAAAELFTCAQAAVLYWRSF
jgi:hypothetical protein